jgi:putative DNA primase/helicase
MELNIATGKVYKSRETKTWKNVTITWKDLVKKLSETIRTNETYKQYCAITKEQQSDIKDKGSFVGGYLIDGKRSPGTVEFRQLLTLDMDLATLEFWDEFCMLYACEAVLHSTHKHSPKTPRYRLVIPLDRHVTSLEYEAIARKVAAGLDINLFDPTTFQPERLMYWPTTSKDGVWVFEHQKGKPLNADSILSKYHDWQDISSWPTVDGEKDFARMGSKVQGAPFEKPGLIGAFNRAYPISAAIEAFLPDVYEATEDGQRYTYVQGSGAKGAIVYGEDEFLYSNHGTDPIHGKLVNSYDLVRLHLFGGQDGDEKELSKQKSNKLMNDFVAEDPNVRGEVGSRRLASDDFDVLEEVDWLKTLTIDKFGLYDATIPNFYTIISNDPNLKGRLKYNLFSHRAVGVLPLPWKEGTGEIELADRDDAGLRMYLEKRYNLYHGGKYMDAVLRVLHDNAFHPIKEYIDALSWDGEERIDTLYIDYLGAPDTKLNREVTRKAFVAAVARVYQPGIKFDYVLTSVGPEGIGKSTILDYLGGEWFSDSFMGVTGKEAFEQLQGSWIIEIAELSGFKKSEVEAVKHFISKKIDRFRVAFGHRVQSFPRQCAFFGTTNEYGFLKGTTGNRRFWPIVVTGVTEHDLKDMPVDQIWAEAKVLFEQGERLYLDADFEEEARDLQAEHSETDDRMGPIVEYLNTPLPLDWSSMELHQRRSYLGDPLAISQNGEVQRTAVCVAELWAELFRAELKDMGPHNTKYIHQIMATIPGWERADNNLTFPIYGRQKAYILSGKIVKKRRANRI